MSRKNKNTTPQIEEVVEEVKTTLDLAKETLTQLKKAEPEKQREIYSAMHKMVVVRN